MSKYFTQNSHYKKIQNDNSAGGAGASASTSKIMATSGGGGGGGSGGKQHYTSYQFIQQKAGGSSAASTTTSIGGGGGSNNMTPSDIISIKNESNNPPHIHQTKMSTHLLDHGYGATPQPQFIKDTGKATTKSSEFCITNYYKVCVFF